MGFVVMTPLGHVIRVSDLRYSMPRLVVAAQDGARSSAEFQMISQRWPSGSWKYPE
jgi:hypothetical protein